MINSEFVNEYIRKTIKKNGGILRELEDFAKIHHVPIIQPEVARLMLVLGNLLKPKKILEIGTAIGYSSILLSEILANGGKIDTIERYENRAQEAKGNIMRAGLGNVINVIIGDALEVLECLDKKYDMIFMDAAKGQYPEFLPECLRMLNSGGLLISDNILYKGMVANDECIERRHKTITNRLREYLDSLCNNEYLETSIIPISDGVAVSYKKAMEN